MLKLRRSLVEYTLETHNSASFRTPPQAIVIELTLRPQAVLWAKGIEDFRPQQPANPVVEGHRWAKLFTSCRCEKGYRASQLRSLSVGSTCRPFFAQETSFRHSSSSQ